MSVILKCDMCGKTASKKVTFDKTTLKIQLPTKKGSNLNFYIDIKVEDNSSKEAASDFQHACAKLGITSPEDCEALGETELMEIFNLQEKTINTLENNADICVCDHCKREALKLAYAYGSYNKLQNLLKIEPVKPL